MTQAVTSEKRREVAERLRGLVCVPLVQKALGLEYDEKMPNSWMWYTGESVRCLASLIEPPPQCPHYDSSRHYCSVHGGLIDREALLRLEKHIDRIAEETEAHFASVVSVRELREIAQGIREAIGVTP